MPEGTIFQEPSIPQNSTSLPPVPLHHSDSPFSKFFKSPIAKIGLIIFLLLTILLSFLTFILPKVSSKPEENVTLTYWGLFEETSIMQEIIEEFEKENPTIKVNYAMQDPKDYMDKLRVRVPSGNGPDIFRFYNSWYPMLSGTLLPLPKVTIEKKEFTNNNYSVVQNDLIKNGAIYGIPLGIDTLALYVNSSLFDEASKELGSEIKVPTTWQEFIDTSQALTKRTEDGKIDIAGAGIGTFENVTHGPDIISLLFAQNGADPNNISASDSKVADALRFYTNFALLENNVWDETLDPTILAFSQGKLAMYFGYSWDYFTIKKSNPDMKFNIALVPQLSSENNSNIARYFAEGVSSKSKHQKEALLFMKFLARAEVQEKFYQEAEKSRGFGEPYADKKLGEKLKGSEFSVFVEQAKTAVSSPFVGETYDNGLNDKLNDQLRDGVNSILSGSSEKTASDNLYQGYIDVLSEYGMGPGQTEK